MTNSTNNSLTKAAELLRTSRSAVALTGAGISVASGIPDFRSPEGLWSEFDPMEYATMDAFTEDPKKVWQMFVAVSRLVRKAHPNVAHIALAELEHAGRLKALITQNIDGLHQLAGSKKVVELHGTGRILACPDCNYQEPTPEPGLQPEPVPCPRVATVPGTHHQHKFLKPAVVLFGEDVKHEAYMEFIHWQNTMDLLLIVGTSVDVYPAVALPSAVKALGGKIIEVNLSPTRITETLTDCFLEGRAEEILPALTKMVLS